MRVINKKNVIWLVLTAAGEAGICYLFNIMSGNGGFSFSFFSIPVLFIIAFCLKKTIDDWMSLEDRNVRKRREIYSFLTSYLFSVSLVMGYQLRKNGMLSVGYKGKAFIILVSAALAVCFLMPLNYWFRFLERKADEEADKEAVFGKDGHLKKGTFFGCWLVIFLFWVPVFMAFYPAVMAHDFNRQAGEAYNGWIWFNDHHPLMHTMLIRIAFLIGEKVGSLRAGMACYSIFQMLVMSAVFAYCCCMVNRLTKKKIWVWCAVFFFAILPFQPIMALSVTKDSLFSAFFLLFLLLIMERRFHHGKGFKVLLDIFLVADGILTVLFRNNAIYALTVFFAVYIFWSKKERIKVLILCVLILAGGIFAKNMIRTVMNAGTGSKVEMYSVPLAQMARVGYTHENTVMTEDEIAMLEEIIPHFIWENYNPYIIDSVKANTAGTTFQEWRNDIPKMLKIWLTLGIKYPNEYIDAFLQLTQGYWFLDDVSHAEVLGYGADSRLGLLYTFDATPDFLVELGLSEKSKFPALFELYKKIVNGNAYYYWPGISNLFKPAFYCWLLIGVMISLAYMRKGKRQIINILPLAYLLTMFLGPVVLFRYTYPIAIAIPLLLAGAFSRTEWSSHEN